MPAQTRFFLKWVPFGHSIILLTLVRVNPPIGTGCFALHMPPKSNSGFKPKILPRQVIALKIKRLKLGARNRLVNRPTLSDSCPLRRSRRFIKKLARLPNGQVATFQNGIPAPAPVSVPANGIFPLAGTPVANRQAVASAGSFWTDVPCRRIL